MPATSSKRDRAMKIALLALPALALLSACAADPSAMPPRMTSPNAMAPAAPPPMAAPAPMDMDGRYAGTARLVAGQRGCRIRTADVTANVMGDRVTVMSGRRSMEGMVGPGGAVTFSDGMMTNTRVESGMIMGDSMMNNCQYTVSLRKVGMSRRGAGRPMSSGSMPSNPVASNSDDPRRM